MAEVQYHAEMVIFASHSGWSGAGRHSRQWEIHAQSGKIAGKSTLMKILSGALPKIYDIYIGAKSQYQPPKACFGISVNYQEFALVGSLTVAENIFIDRPAKRNITGGGCVASAPSKASVQRIPAARRFRVKRRPRQARDLQGPGPRCFCADFNEPTSAWFLMKQAVVPALRSLRDKGVTVSISHR